VGCGVECPSPAPWPSPGQTVAFRHCSLQLQQGFGLRPTCRTALLRSQPYCFCNLNPDLCPPDDPISLIRSVFRPVHQATYHSAIPTTPQIGLYPSRSMGC
jgi:hypothetical protein